MNTAWLPVLGLAGAVAAAKSNVVRLSRLPLGVRSFPTTAELVSRYALPSVVFSWLGTRLASYVKVGVLNQQGELLPAATESVSLDHL